MNAATQSTLKPFRLLAEPDRYVACPWDMSADEAGRVHLITFFKRHILTILKLGIDARLARGESEQSVRECAERCRAAFDQRYDDYLNHIASFGRVTIIDVAKWREQLLRAEGFNDAFLDVKRRENAKMLPLLPQLLTQLDQLSGVEQLQAIVEGVFAGNIFDMGAEATAKAFVGQSPDFFATRSKLPPRPWLIDEFDAFATRAVNDRKYRKAIFFVDNAGSDFLLGAVPMIRWMIQQQIEVVIAANELPTLNDMTIAEVKAIWPAIVTTVPDLREAPISFVSSGTGEPLIDLLGVSDELNEAADNTNLIILEGMGRGVESNLNALFTCDALNLAMIKDQLIASHVGGKVFDVVCRFREGLG